MFLYPRAAYTIRRGSLFAKVREVLNQESESDFGHTPPCRHVPPESRTSVPVLRAQKARTTNVP
jgi:hypothetical protein